MKRLATILSATCLLSLAIMAAPAQADFGFNLFNVTFTEENGEAATEAGSHPFAMTTSLRTNLDADEEAEGWLRNFLAKQIPGLIADTTAYPRCTTLQFLAVEEGINACPLETQVGIAGTATKPGSWLSAPIFNLTPPPGVLLRLGFRTLVPNIVIDVGITQDPPYRGTGLSRNTPQLISVSGVKLQLLGDPANEAHEDIRGICGFNIVEGLPPGDVEGFQFEPAGGTCPVEANSKPFLTLPTNCAGPLTSEYEATSWEGDIDTGSAQTPPFKGCEELGFKPSISAAPTSKAAQSPTGLDLSLAVKDEGLTSLEGRSQSDIRRVAITLPEGMTANPSLAEGLEVCTESDLAQETLNAAPGQGCPQASKIGNVEVESPLVEEPIKGALFQAKPFDNLADDSLIALYIVIKNPKLGILVKQTAKVIPDPKTGQLQGITDDIPQLPFSSFRLHFREGGRSPLVSPPTCGTHQVKATITPWSGTAPIQTTSSFQTISGPNEGPCPKGGTPPFEPGFAAGSQNNAAKAFSPFSMRLTRRDGDQDLTRFDAILPPGVLAKLAGVTQCPNAQIALAKAKSGTAEKSSPSCPASSKIGSVWAGAGVGSQLTYVPGSVYLAGPFAGAPLSVLGVVPAVAGPFDIGTVITRQALVINPRTGEVTADGAKSDPIPHILAGIPLVVRDIQVNVDRPDFTITPTNCDPFATKAAIWGGGTNLFSTVDDSPVQREARYQVANCSRLGFKPKLSLKLKGGMRRGDNPKLRAQLTPRSQDANISGTVVRLPRSAFLDQGHIRTICTRVQYAAKACPPGAIYGQVRAFTPLLSEPLEGPAYLRSSDHNLPDMVFALKGLVDFEAVARIDSKKGGIRVTFTGIPDAPISKVVVNMQGGKKGLIVNSTDLCKRKHHANVELDAQSGKELTIKPLMGAGGCGKG